MEIFPSILSSFEFGMLILFICMTGIQFFWTIMLHSRVAFHHEQHHEGLLPPISIIITARNEEDNLMENLPVIFEQQYSTFEVIVVNNQSVDDTGSVLKAFQEKYPQLRVIEIERNHHLAYGKKLAITVAIKGAKYDHIIVTDPDSCPASKRWITDIAGKFSTQKELVIGFSSYTKQPGLLNRIIRLDNTVNTLQAIALGKSGVIIKGNRKNMGYSKSLFISNNGFKDHYSLQSGDEDLFVQKIAKKRNYAFSLSPLSHTTTSTENTWKEWFQRKSEECTAKAKYSVFKKALLGIYSISLILFYVSFVILLMENKVCWLIWGAFGLILLLKWVILGRAFKKLSQQTLVAGVVLWDLLFAFLNPIIYYTHDQSIGNKWK